MRRSAITINIITGSVAKMQHFLFIFNDISCSPAVAAVTGIGVDNLVYTLN